MRALPPGIDSILEFLADKAAGYGNKLKWNEQAKLKADLMNVPQRWAAVPVGEVAARCRQLGMRAQDVDLITDLITQAQAGRRLAPQPSYRDYRFQTPLDAMGVGEPLRASRDR